MMKREPEDVRFRRIKNEAAQRLHELLEREPKQEPKFVLTDSDKIFLGYIHVKAD